MPATAPLVLKRRQRDREQQRREIRAARNRKRQAHHERDILPFEQDAEDDGEDAEDHGGCARHRDLFVLRRVAAPDDVDEDVVRERARARERQAGNRTARIVAEDDGGDEAENRPDSPSRSACPTGRASPGTRRWPMPSLVAATPLPASGDLENGHAEAPDGVAETVRLAAEAGLAGASIEDTDLPGRGAYPFELAVERLRAAAAAARAYPGTSCWSRAPTG